MEQDQALAILESGKSVLLTGAAGTGKTYLLRKFIRRAREDGRFVSVTATTGLAATHLNGATIHAWSGIGVHDVLPASHFNKISKQRRDIISKTDVLIIDEISMLHDFRLDLVDEVLQSVRESEFPFGGIQVVLCGDFFQLPPVNRSDSRQGSFVTESDAWRAGNFTVCYLDRQYRQAKDTDYRDILNGIRAGFLTRGQLDVLQARSTPPKGSSTPLTRLLTTNVDVDSINAEHLKELDGDVHEYAMQTSGGKNYIEQLKRSCLAPETLQLKLGASVMCIKNSTDKKFVNGSLGTVIGFDEDSDYPVVKLVNGNTVTIKPDAWELVDGEKRRAMLTQLPLRLAWAITVHKSQGMTLDAARIDLRRAFVEGMGYVALSRVRGLEFLTLDGLNSMALRVSPLAKAIDSDLRTRSAEALVNYSDDIKSWGEYQKIRTAKPPKLAKPTTGWAEKIAKMRETYPNAYMPWKEDDDAKLLKLFADKKSLKDLTTHFGRHPGSIRSRLEKHFGEGVMVA